MAEVFSFLTAWLAPITCFTAEEAWLLRPQDVPDGKADSVHLRLYPIIPAGWADFGAGRKMEDGARAAPCRHGVLQPQRAEKRIGSSLQAAPHVPTPRRNTSRR